MLNLIQYQDDERAGLLRTSPRNDGKKERKKMTEEKKEKKFSILNSQLIGLDCFGQVLAMTEKKKERK